MGEINALLDSFSPRSLAHSVITEINSKMRQYQLSAKLFDRFDNFIGMTLVKDDTTPIGDTEVGDSGRTIRLETQMKNFIAKHGFRPPAAGDAREFLTAYTAGKATPEQQKLASQWEAWAEDENRLMGDFYGLAKKEVDPIRKGILYTISGPGWASTWQGGYPVTAHANQNPLICQVGSGDYGMMFILDPFVKTRLFTMAGNEVWGNQGFHGTPGFYNLKDHFAGFLAAGATGYGYYHGKEREFNDPNYFCTLGTQKSRQDIRDILKTYGPMLRQIKPTADIGIFYPFHQTMYEVTNADTPDGQGHPRRRCLVLGHGTARVHRAEQPVPHRGNARRRTGQAVQAGHRPRRSTTPCPGISRPWRSSCRMAAC